MKFPKTSSPLLGPLPLGFVNAGDFVEKAGPRPPDLVTGLIYKGAFGLIAGPPKRGKTEVALGILSAVNHGTPAFGLLPSQLGRVAIIELEHAAWAWADRLYRHNLAGEEVPLLHGVRVSIDHPNFALALAQFCAAYDVRLLLIDTMADAHGQPEDDATAMSKVIDGLRIVRLHSPRTTILVVHHLRKLGDRRHVSLEDVRGSTRITGAFDLIFAVDGVNTATGLDLTLRTLAAKDIAPPRDVELSLTIAPGEFATWNARWKANTGTSVGVASPSPAPVAATTKPTAYQQLMSAVLAGAVFKNKTEAYRALGGNRQAAFTAFDRAASQGDIVKGAAGWHAAAAVGSGSGTGSGTSVPAAQSGSVPPAPLRGGPGTSAGTTQPLNGVHAPAASSIVLPPWPGGTP
jgi:hypothetical protein